MPARLRFILLILPFLLAPCPQRALAQTPKPADVRVTIQKERITLYDLLNEVNAQTARAAAGKPIVILRVDPDDSAAATPVAVFVKAIRLPVLADALAATLTIRKAAWRWIPGDAPPSKDDDANAVKPEDFKAGAIYTLRPNAAARIYASRIRAQILSDLLGEAQEVHDNPNEVMPEPPPVIPAKSAPSEIELYRELEKGAKRSVQLANAARPAFALITPAQFDAIIRGSEVPLKLDALPVANATIIQELLTADDSTKHFENGVEIAPTGPPEVTLNASSERGVSQIAPYLTILSRVTRTYGQPGTPDANRVGIGGLLFRVGEKTEARWRSRLTEEWNAPDKSANRKTTTAQPAPPYPDSLASGVGAQSPFPVIVRLDSPATVWKESSEGEGASLQWARRVLLTGQNIATRWHSPGTGAKEDAALIGTALSWVWQAAPEHLVSPTYRARLIRTAREDPMGRLTLETLLDAAKRLTQEAMLSLEPDFPETMRQAARFHGILRALGQNASLRRETLSKEGASLANSPALLSVIQDSKASGGLLESAGKIYDFRFPPPPPDYAMDARTLRLRLKVTEAHALLISLCDVTGKMLLGEEFLLPAVAATDKEEKSETP